MTTGAVVFDFDGVLIESVEIKSRAFLELFRAHPEHHEAIRRYHLDHLGISRYEKFAWVHEELLGQHLGTDERAELGRRYSEIVFAQARSCPAVAGADRALEGLQAAGVPLYVASGTPEAELRELVEARGWARRFRAVYGSPRRKPEILRRVTRELGLGPAEVVMVGDGRSDFEAANEAHVRFVLRETADQAAHFADYAGPRVPDMVGILETLGLAAGQASDE
jgi:phosphoglycolate phosphatase-like HAD superfamily hydrolase